MYERLCQRKMLWTVKCNYLNSLHLYLYGNIILSDNLHNICLLATNTINLNFIILHRYAATCFNQLRGHPQAVYIHKT